VDDRNLVVSEGNVQVDSACSLNDRCDHCVANFVVDAGLEVVADVVLGLILTGHGPAIYIGRAF